MNPVHRLAYNGDFARCSLDPYESRYGRFTASPARTALKNSQLTRRLPGDITIICETVH